MYRIKYIIYIFVQKIWWYTVYVYNFKPPKNESFWFENSWNGSENRLVPILVIQRLAPTWWLSRVLSMTTKQKFDKWMPKHVIMMARKWGPIKYIQTYWHVMTRACSFLFSSMTGNSGGSSKTRRMIVWGSSFQTRLLLHVQHLRFFLWCCSDFRQDAPQSRRYRHVVPNISKGRSTINDPVTGTSSKGRQKKCSH